MRVRIFLVTLSLMVFSTHAFAGDAVKGATLYEDNCAGCHSLDANRVGPSHRGVFGRKAGVVPDFDYSDALRKSPVVWNEATLDRWLSSPMDFIKGAAMPFRINSPQVRADIIAYLRKESGK
jgi:cytochrome c